MHREGASQAALAKKIGVSQSSITQWLRGVNPPKQDKVEAFRAAFGIDLAFFVDESLGEAPDYRKHLASSRESRVESDVITPEELAQLTAKLGTPPTYEEIRWVLATPHHRMSVREMFIAIDSARTGMTPEQHAAMEAETARFAKR